MDGELEQDNHMLPTEISVYFLNTYLHDLINSPGKADQGRNSQPSPGEWVGSKGR